MTFKIRNSQTFPTLTQDRPKRSTLGRRPCSDGPAFELEHRVSGFDLFAHRVAGDAIHGRDPISDLLWHASLDIFVFHPMSRKERERRISRQIGQIRLLKRIRCWCLMYVVMSQKERMKLTFLKSCNQCLCGCSRAKKKMRL